MTRGEAWFSHAATALVGGTGVIYGWMRYFAEPKDEFALVNHPLQPAFQSLHILLAPALVFACALFWRDHVWKRVRSGHVVRRRSGLVLFALLFPMIASGYLIQTSTGELARKLAIGFHLGTSCLWIVGYAGHQLLSRRDAGGVSATAVRGSTGPSGESTASSMRRV